MERPAARYFCNKCGYIGSQSSHANCNYFACTTLEYQYIEQQERELTDLRARCEKAEKDAARLRGVRELCGYAEDGSAQTVRIFQDDATKDWFVCFGQNGREFARSFESAIDATIAKEKQC